MNTRFDHRRRVSRYNHDHVFNERLECMAPICQISWHTMEAQGWVRCPGRLLTRKKTGRHKSVGESPLTKAEAITYHS